MHVFKTMVTFTDHDEGTFYLADIIFREGSWWLVGSWLESNATGERTPEWLVRLTGLRYQEIEGEGKPYRFLLNSAIPKAVLRGEAQEGYEVVRCPMPDASTEPRAKPH